MHGGWIGRVNNVLMKGMVEEGRFCEGQILETSLASRHI